MPEQETAAPPLREKTPQEIRTWLIENGGVEEIDPYTGREVITLFGAPNADIPSALARRDRLLLELLNESAPPKKFQNFQRLILPARPIRCPWCRHVELSKPQYDKEDRQKVISDPRTVYSPETKGCYHYDARTGIKVHRFHVYCNKCRRTDDFTRARIEKVGVLKTEKMRQKADPNTGTLLNEWEKVSRERPYGWWLSGRLGEEAGAPYDKAGGFTPEEIMARGAEVRIESSVRPEQDVTEEQIGRFLETDEGRQRLLRLGLADRVVDYEQRKGLAVELGPQDEIKNVGPLSPGRAEALSEPRVSVVNVKRPRRYQIVPCPVQGCGKTLKGGGAVAGHMRFQHGLTMDGKPYAGQEAAVPQAQPPGADAFVSDMETPPDVTVEGAT